jgi:hypothetical protein
MRYINTRNTYKLAIESPRMHAKVNVHTTWHNGDVDTKVMEMHEALTYQASMMMEAKVITVWPVAA